MNKLRTPFQIQKLDRASFPWLTDFLSSSPCACTAPYLLLSFRFGRRRFVWACSKVDHNMVRVGIWTDFTSFTVNDGVVPTSSYPNIS